MHVLPANTTFCKKSRSVGNGVKPNSRPWNMVDRRHVSVTLQQHQQLASLEKSAAPLVLMVLLRIRRGGTNIRMGNYLPFSGALMSIKPFFSLHSRFGAIPDFGAMGSCPVCPPLGTLTIVVA
ncbi:hypothetical protein AVEN_161001-1 [Araneus ventricosus]|uniref:Uncharacterized protein n=1 Tax=Araneus ventricosus TaxID=182803 RepID=A0A4Y2FYK9_ARAVE|nr:hypothetical protein AVEN_161001-1 [Araneus ventricosus]